MVVLHLAFEAARTRRTLAQLLMKEALISTWTAQAIARLRATRTCRSGLLGAAGIPRPIASQHDEVPRGYSAVQRYLSGSLAR